MTFERKRFRIATDIGGTFTDFVTIDASTGVMQVEKTLTTPDDPARGIFNGLKLLAEIHDVTVPAASAFVHGTTLVINALIERKGTTCALLVTHGFRDVLEMRNESRYDVYDLQLEFPQPLVPRSLRFEVTERTDGLGKSMVRPDEDEVAAIALQLKSAGVRSVAVAFLHSYANPLHEKQVRGWLASHAPDVAISLSCEVLPQIKEYERTSTTVANAYVKPLVQRYLQKVSDGLAEQGFKGSLHVMQSSGGVVSRQTAQEFPIRILESGPAGGVAAAQWWGERMHHADLLCFDMGGTTAKLCTVIDGAANVADEYEAARIYRNKRGSGIALAVPVFDLLEIGTGGGSIARIDSLGLVKVGPQSAGASPGPVAYGLGGSQPTVTDADVVLGYLDPSYFLGGSMPLQASKAREAIETRLAQPLSLPVMEAAYGIHDIANEDMASAAQLHLAEMGHDTAKLVLVAYGGAGPIHAFGLARKLGVRKLLIPPAAGVMSAFGMLVSNVSMDRVRTIGALLPDANLEEIVRGFYEIEQEGREMLHVPDGVFSAQRSADLRYRGQGHTVRVRWPDPLAVTTLVESFERVYTAQYGRVYPELPIELVNLRAVVTLQSDIEVTPHRIAPATESIDCAVKGSRKAYFGRQAGFLECTVYDRYRLQAGHTGAGPALVEERETTTVIGPGATFDVNTHGMLSIHLEP